MINKKFTLAKRPIGMPADDCWDLVESEIPELLANQSNSIKIREI